MKVPGSHNTRPRGTGPIAAALAVAAAAFATAGCSEDRYDGRVAGWALVDHTQRHPILVGQEPSQLAVHVAPGSNGLSPRQRAEIVDFAGAYRVHSAGASRLVVEVPSGGANEQAAMYAADEIRDVLGAGGFPEQAISIEPYQSPGGAAPIRLSYLRYVAEAPQCGNWPTNLAREPNNLPYHDFGCSTQRNLAVQIANPGDLVSPRGMMRRPGERRDTVNDKFIRGEPTGAERSPDESIDLDDE